MRWMASGLITLSLVYMGCASQSQDSQAGGTAPPTSRLVSAATHQPPGSPDTQILLDKIKADKKFLVASNMERTDVEAAKFWPLYEQYQQRLNQINQRMAGTILEYADGTAAKLLDEALAVDEAEVALKKSYAAQFSEVLPAAKTARYLQIETKIRSLLRLDLARSIPLVS